MNSSKENPLRGASEILVEISGGKIHLDANLGGVKFMILFLMTFPILMVGFIVGASFFSSGWETELKEIQTWYVPAFWMVVSPLFSIWVRKRTVNALDDLLGNAVSRATK